MVTAALTGLPTVPTVLGAVRHVKNGVVSLSLANEFVAGLVISSIDSPAEPAEGFDVGLLVVEGSTFAINVADGQFAGFRNGSMELLGGITYMVLSPPTPVLFGDFAVVWDAEHEPEQFYLLGRFAIPPVFDLLLPMGDFATGTVDYDDTTGQLVAADIDVVVSMDFAEAVGFPPLAGTPLGRIRMDLTMVVPNGDADDDTDVDLDDYARYTDCVSGPSELFGDNICATFDFEDDGDVDLADLAALQKRFTGELFTLDVRSEVAGDVEIGVAPVDYFGNGGGATPFRLAYEPGVDVTLTAPPQTLLTDFVRWRVDDSDLPAGENILSLTMVYAPIIIVEDPQSLGTCVGESFGLSVTACVIRPPPFAYGEEWGTRRSATLT